MFRIGKRFKWEMAHRLVRSFSEQCQNIHGHSYKMEVILEGELNEDGVLMDFGAVKQTVQPIVDSLDHSIAMFNKDPMISSISTLGVKYIVLPYNPTAENMAQDVMNTVLSSYAGLEGLVSVTVRIWETETGWAECSKTVQEFFLEMQNDEGEENEVQG